MTKTKKTMSFLLLENIIKIIVEYSPLYDPDMSYCYGGDGSLYNKDGVLIKQGLKKINIDFILEGVDYIDVDAGKSRFIIGFNFQLDAIEDNLNRLYAELYVIEQNISNNGDDSLETSKTATTNKIEQLVVLKNTILLDIIHRTAKDKRYRNNFVFPILKNEDFTQIDEKNNFSLLSEKLYKKIDSRCVIYNKNLDIIQHRYDIKTKIRSHISRHTFTQLMISRGVEWYIIYKCLGHTNFNTTKAYLNSLDTSSVDKGITTVNELLEPKGGNYKEYSKYIDIEKIDLPF